MEICLVNDAGLVEGDLAVIKQAVQYFVPLVTSAWKLPAYTVTTSPIRKDGVWNILITEKNRKAGANGFHALENGLPVAYCSPKASFYTYGKILKQILIGGKLIRPLTYREGLVTTICHEIAEMLCDQKITTYSKPDAQGRKWLVEVCDHCFGSYLIHTISGTDCVLPDVTTPAFYDVKGASPYTLNNAVTAPFTLTPKGYGYYQSGMIVAKLR
jgi:hypothetical protein